MITRLHTRSLLSALALFLLLAPQWMVQTGCANMAPPLGGAKDSLPPVLIAARPADSSTNFTGEKITLVFDEFVQLDNVTQNLLISPSPKTPPQVESKLRTVTITIKDTLEPNTTYTYDFGNSIKDVNESNVMKNFRYAFSTGPTLDDGIINGQVILAENGKSDSTLFAILHLKNEDSTVYKDMPRYVTRLDSKGQFQFHNLPRNIQYYLYALKDEGGQRRYMDSTKLFAFKEEPVSANDTTGFLLYAYAKKRIEKPSSSSTRPTSAKAAAAAAADKRLRFETNLDNGEQDLLKPLTFTFKVAPLKEFDSSKIQFLDDKFNPIKGYTITRDTSNTKLTLQYNWTENSKYYLLVDKTFATDTSGRQLLKNDTLTFSSKKASTYGMVRLRFLNLDLTKNPVLQLAQGDNVVYSHIFTSKEFYAKLFVPGEYEMRILYDDNKNGLWDPGNYFDTRRQPELVKPIVRKLNVKANWDNEIDVNL